MAARRRSCPALAAQTPTAGDRPTLRVPRVEDFAISGQGDHATWARLAWVALNGRQGVTGAPATRIKVAYSATGLYVLMDAADQKLTATYQEDFSDLWKEDVFEVFLWPDERDTIYFEYEVSPLGRELPILIPELRRSLPRAGVPGTTAAIGVSAISRRSSAARCSRERRSRAGAPSF